MVQKQPVGPLEHDVRPELRPETPVDVQDPVVDDDSQQEEEVRDLEGCLPEPE